MLGNVKYMGAGSSENLPPTIPRFNFHKFEICVKCGRITFR